VPDTRVGSVKICTFDHLFGIIQNIRTSRCITIRDGIVRFHRTPRTHHHFSAPAKLLIVLLALRDVQSKRPASNKLGRVGIIRHHRAQTPRRVLSPRTNRANRAGSCVATSTPTTLRGPPLVVLIERREKTLFCPHHGVDFHRSIVHRTGESIYLPIVTARMRYMHSPIRRRRPTEFRLFVVEHVFFTWLDVIFSCIDFVFTFLSTNSFEFLFSPDRLTTVCDFC